jgi:hypothetical protein
MLSPEKNASGEAHIYSLSVVQSYEEFVEREVIASRGRACPYPLHHDWTGQDLRANYGNAIIMNILFGPKHH